MISSDHWGTQSSTSHNPSVVKFVFLTIHSHDSGHNQQADHSDTFYFYVLLLLVHAGSFRVL